MINPEKKEAAPLDPWIIDEILRKEKERKEDKRPEIGIRIETPEIEETPGNPRKQEEGNWRRGVEEMEI